MFAAPDDVPLVVWVVFWVAFSTGVEFWDEEEFELGVVITTGADVGVCSWEGVDAGPWFWDEVAAGVKVGEEL